MKFLKRERISTFEEAGLGLKRDNVVVLKEHSPKWSEAFKLESNFLLDHLAIDSLTLHHAGSTSIPGIVAKPIIDIVGGVDSLAELDRKKELFESIGYVYKGEYGIPGRRYSVLYNPDQTMGFVHLHVFEKDDPNLKKHLLFRDYLRINTEAAKEYETVKKGLDIPRDQYTDGKSEVISKLLEEAIDYFKKD